SEEDGRKPASKTYVQLLRNRIDLLEAVLQSHTIDVEAAVAQLSATGSAPQLPSIASTLATGSDAGLSVSAFDDLCATFEGALSLDESVNYDQDGEMRYFGPASGRLEFQSGAYRLLLSPAGLVIDKSLESTPESDDHGSPLTSKSTETNRYILPLEADVYPDDLTTELIDLFFETDTRSIPDDQNSAGKVFLQKAEVLLHYDMKRPNITTIQSMSILVGVYVSYGCDAAGWLHQGMANRLALDMGLNLDASSLSGTCHMSNEEVELRRQIYWALYCDDKLAAIYTGRVCSLLDVQGAVHLPSTYTPEQMSAAATNDSCDVNRCNKKVLVHRGLIGLCRILENILLALYAPKPLYKGPQRISFLQSCTLELKTWFYELPADLRIDKHNDLPQVYTLHMVYHTCCILLFKPFLLKSKDTPPALKTDTAKRAEVLCIESAKRICHAGKKYRQVFGSFRRSPITATHCTLTAALVLIQYASPDPEFANTGRPCCTVYIEACLEVLADLGISWRPAAKMRSDLIKYLHQKYPERMPNSILQEQDARKDPDPDPTAPASAAVVESDTNGAVSSSMQPQPTLEQSLCPLINMIDQDFTWDESSAADQTLQGALLSHGGSESAFNTQFALADSIGELGEQNGLSFMDDSFWAGMNFDMNLEMQNP
ncbi:nitrogen assimilation transcription factor nirA, partial [Colletotrichum tamarilloi]